jgi:membrane peptidoglycan carboxypeptidase
MFEALLAAEDHRALMHRGIDWFSIGRAIYRSAGKNGFRGISTVEQQLVRTIFPRSGMPRWKRKPPEFALAFGLGTNLNKTTIWAAYLHCAYYGRDYPSYSRIRERFAGDAVLDEVSAARIASCLKYPSPHRDETSWLSVHERRTKYVLRRLTTIKKDKAVALITASELQIGE